MLLPLPKPKPKSHSPSGVTVTRGAFDGRSANELPSVALSPSSSSTPVVTRKARMVSLRRSSQSPATSHFGCPAAASGQRRAAPHDCSTSSRPQGPSLSQPTPSQHRYQSTAPEHHIRQSLFFRTTTGIQRIISACPGWSSPHICASVS